MSFLALADVRKTYPDGTAAVRGVNLAIEAGEFIVLLGPSGCGKTTTLRMIAGLEQPTGGTITLDGRDVTNLRPIRRDVGFVFQFFALYPHMTVRANIGYPLAGAGVGRAERKAQIEQVADKMGLTGLLDRYPAQLSGGDQQRVSLARAIVRRPAVFLMDEPLGTLDADQRLEMREFIRARQLEMGVTTIYVTHDQEEAMSLADRIVVMEGGLVRQQGPPMEVYDNPADRFVAEFVGSPGMNFLSGEVAVDAGRAVFLPRGADATVALVGEHEPGPATLGVRPEFVRCASDAPLAGRVVLNEYQGSFRCVHVDVGTGRNVVARVEPDQGLTLGASVRLAFDVQHVRLFHAESGVRV